MQLEDTMQQNNGNHKSKVEYLIIEMELKSEAHLSELECLKEERDQNLEENNNLREILQSKNVGSLIIERESKNKSKQDLHGIINVKHKH
jgi:hypothetical protein